MLLIHFADAPRPRRDGDTNERAVSEFEGLPAEEQKTIYAEWQAINEVPGVTPGVQLQPPERATTVRVQNGKTLATDGPFAEAKEALGGYYILDAEGLDVALDVASRVPVARMGGAVEVRPMVEW